jgi:ribosome-binding factor A
MKWSPWISWPDAGHDHFGLSIGEHDSRETASQILWYPEKFIRLEEEAMPEHRGRKHHQDRVAEALRVEIGAMIEGELSDPRIDFCYVSEVALNPGGKSARVYVAIDSAVKDVAKSEQQTIAGLEAAKGYIRHGLKERMGVRRVPDLCFLIDRSGRFQARIEELMSRSRKHSSARHDSQKVEPVSAKPAAEQRAQLN